MKPSQMYNGMRVWWSCPDVPEHEWKATPAARVRGANPRWQEPCMASTTLISPMQCLRIEAHGSEQHGLSG